MIRLSRLAQTPARERLAGGVDYNHRDVKSSLMQEAHGKCVYCESRVRDVAYGEIDHIKPKSRFPDLRRDYDNLAFCCQMCNNAKSSYYSDGDGDVVNPYVDDPGDHFRAVGPWIIAKGGSERAAVTLAAIDLNRSELIESRNEKLRAIAELWNCADRANPVKLRAIVRAIERFSDAEEEYSFVCSESRVGR